MSTLRKTCDVCGAALTGDAARGLCPGCLLQAALGSQTDDPDATVADAAGAGRRCRLPEVGKQFGPYHISRLLGRGGMGVVYEAEEQDTGRRIALKVLGRQFDSPSDRARFLREGRLAASINHPNSVYVYGTEEIDGTPTIAMELVSGGTLQERVKNQGPMPVSAAVDAILQIIAGLEAAQAIGVLHRDIKPGNCFEDADGLVKIGDFGLSISTAVRAEPNISATGVLIGTPAFCSPEQLRGDELSVRCDMYSVGATLFFLLTGRVPFEGHNIVQLTANVLEEPAPSPRDFRKEIPKGLAGAIQRCLAKQPTDRFKSYGDLRQALTPYSSTAPTPATLSLRFLAGILDSLIIDLPGMIVFYLVGYYPMNWLQLTGARTREAFLLVSGSFAVMLLYYAVCEGIWGASAGKALARLRVVTPDKNPPGFWRALLRALIYLGVPALPSWIAFGISPRAVMQSPLILQMLLGLAFYVVLALLFSTVRRRNGFAALQDLVTNTRVVLRPAIESRPVLAAADAAPPVVDGKSTVGPYHVLDTLETSAEGQWLLGYDLRLLRKVWIHTVPAGAPPVAASLRNIGRVGRLRWLAGRRTPTENWDAFEGVGGQPLLRLIRERQPWSRVRFWLYDLVQEIGAAEKDGTLPERRTLDRVWITDDGRAKLLDFPAPGLSIADGPEIDDAPAAPPVQEAGRLQRLLGEVALAALEGRTDVAARTTFEPAVPLPLHARSFLEQLPQFPDANAVTAAIRPLLRRVTSVSRWRRAAIVAGCLGVPVFGSLFLTLSMSTVQKTYPGLMELSHVLRERQPKYSTMAHSPGQQKVTELQVAVFIASHYRTLVTNDASWNSPMVLSMIKGDDRRFAEESVARFPAPTEKQITEAEAALEPSLRLVEKSMRPGPLPMIAMLLGVYVCVPALIAAVLFRGGVVLRMAGVTFVGRDGKRASRRCMFSRIFMAWSPLCLLPAILVVVHLVTENLEATVLSGWPPVLYGGLYCALTILSVAMPDRGVPDRLVGTWPVPR
jgi:eukaryotic-like serine/threonine-protein kinase